MTASQQPIMVHRVTLASGKVVQLREMKVKFQNLALQACGNKAKGNDALLGSLMQEELLKILLVDVDGVKPSAVELEKIDEIFAYQEYMQLGQVLGKIIGGNDVGEFQLEIASTTNS